MPSQFTSFMQLKTSVVLTQEHMTVKLNNLLCSGQYDMCKNLIHNQSIVYPMKRVSTFLAHHHLSPELLQTAASQVASCSNLVSLFHLHTLAHTLHLVHTEDILAFRPLNMNHCTYCFPLLQSTLPCLFILS